MAALTQTNISRRHIVGDLVWHHYILSGNNGDTFGPPNLEGNNIEQVVVTPTTAISVGATWTNDVITFVSAGAWAANVLVYTRLG